VLFDLFIFLHPNKNVACLRRNVVIGRPSWSDISSYETPGVYKNHETAEVTGGTGRFANATGHFELGGQLDFTTIPPSFVLPWEGVISSVGSRRR
jgi:hypothetical protein